MEYIYKYIVIALFLLWIVQKMNLLKKDLVLLSCGLILAGVLALRNAEFGVVDMLRYSIYYDSMRYMSSFTDALFRTNGKDFGYWGLVYLFSTNGFSFQFFTSVVAIFDIVIFVYFVRKYSPDYGLSCFALLGTGCYTFMFYGLRQAIALPLILLCIDSLYNKKIAYIILWLIMAVLFHWSAVAIIPLLLVSRLKFSTFILGGYFFALLFLMIFSKQIGYVLTILFREEYVDTYESSGGLTGLSILFLLFLTAYVFIQRRNINRSYKVSFFLHAFILLCMIQICSAYAYSFTRLNFYYLMSTMTITLPMTFETNSLKSLAGKESKIFSIIISIGVISLMIRLFFLFIRGNHLEDYTFFWQEI